MTDVVTLLMFSVVICFSIFSPSVCVEPCQFDGPTIYRESCRGGRDQFTCLAGQKKARECLGADWTSQSCVPCEDGSFQDKPNNCTECRPCSECLQGQRVSQTCTVKSDTKCEPEVISTTPDVVQKQSEASTQSLITIAAPGNSPLNCEYQDSGLTKWKASLIALACLVCGLLIGTYWKQVLRICKRECKSNRPSGQESGQPHEEKILQTQPI